MRDRSFLAIALVICGAAAGGLRAQSVRWCTRETFLTTLDRIGDVNGDGVSDVIVGIRSSQEAVVFSGKDGMEIDRLSAPASGTFGDSVRGLSDFDGDGVPEFAVGNPRDDSTFGCAGAVYVYSGRTRTLLRRDDPVSQDQRIGTFLLDTGDWDGDGVDDYVTGAPRETELRSGRDGSILQSFAPPTNRIFETSDTLSDVDGDGRFDLVFGTEFDEEVYVYSSTGTRLLTIKGPRNSDFARSLATLGDLNGDGFDEFVVGASDHSFGNGGAFVYDGATFTVLHEVLGDDVNTELGISVARIDDLTGDGIPDFVLGDGNTTDEDGSGSCNACGSVWLYSGATGERVYHHVFVESGQPGHDLGRSLDDLDGDGLPEILAADSFEGYRICALTTGDLFLDAFEKSPERNDAFQLTLSEGDPAALGAIFLVSFDGNPWLQLLTVQHFDTKRQITLKTDRSPIFDHTLVFFGLALDPGGAVRDSNLESVIFKR